MTAGVARRTPPEVIAEMLNCVDVGCSNPTSELSALRWSAPALRTEERSGQCGGLRTEQITDGSGPGTRVTAGTR